MSDTEVADPAAAKRATIEPNAIYVANESYWVHVDGSDQHIRKGLTRARGAHELVQRNPLYWDPVQENLSFDVSHGVESASREPGEQRTVTTPVAQTVEHHVIGQGAPETSVEPDAGAQVNATPNAIAHAASLGIDIAQVKGSGKDGAVTKTDVQAHADTLTKP